MDPGLSQRAQKTLEELVPTFTAAAPPQQYDAATAVDLASAQNEVLRPELLEFFKTMVEDQVTSSAFSLSGPSLRGGDRQCRQALATFLNNFFDPVHDVQPEHIVIAAGARDALENLIHTICDDGDSVLVPGPYWFGFEHTLKSRANVNIILAQPPTYTNYHNYLLPSLQAAYDFSPTRSRIKAVMICNPSNPLSRCYPKHELIELMEFCQERQLHLISDEVYALSDLHAPPAKSPSFVSALSMTEPLARGGATKVDASRVHTIWSPSKLLGVCGLRIGCVISQQNPTLLCAVSLFASNHTNNIASTFLTSLLNWSQFNTLLKLNKERLTASYYILVGCLNKCGIEYVEPTHGNFLFVKLARKARSAKEEKSFYDELALYGINVAQGRFFRGVDRNFGWARIRFSVDSHVMRAAVERLELFLRQHE